MEAAEAAAAAAEEEEEEDDDDAQGSDDHGEDDAAGYGVNPPTYLRTGRPARIPLFVYWLTRIVSDTCSIQSRLVWQRAVGCLPKDRLPRRTFVIGLVICQTLQAPPIYGLSALSTR